MKVALCLYGIVGGRTGKNGRGGYIDYQLCADHYKKHVLGINDVDVFIHTWSADLKQELIEIYNPVDSSFEKQIQFDMSGANGHEKKFKKALFRSRSRWYSTQKVLDLKKNHELENEFQYDLVMVSRFDLMWDTDVNFQDYDSKYFYASHWNNPPLIRKGKVTKPAKQNKSIIWEKTFRAGFSDLWFMGGSETMDKFGGLYNKLDKKGPITISEISCHRASWNHLHSFHPADKVRYIFYRWFDYEIYRWKVEGVYK